MLNLTSSMFVETYPTEGAMPTVAIKDCIDIAGRVTACGSRALADSQPAPRHAAVVQALADVGWRIAAKASMHELAYGMTGINGWTGTVPNPLYPGRIAGGSSSGSAAAVAAGLVDVALGSDTGGSVRLPAACCGVIGLKPTYGRLSRDGVHPAHSSQDCVGVFARSLDLLDRAMALMDPIYGQAEAGPMRIGTVIAEADEEIAQAVAGAVTASPHSVRPFYLPLMQEAFEAGVILMAAEAHEAYAHLLSSGLLGADVEARLRAAPAVATPDKVAWAQGIRRDVTLAIDAALTACDILALPTLPAFPPMLDDLGDPAAVLRLSALVRPFNLSGHPALSLPLATPSGRPAALQLVAAKGQDARLSAAARHIPFIDITTRTNA
ncbi:amidase family protein [Novosphingobium sp.]|uniref:amidase n=1 Tax=Novosphingobium sp. TaxID=1874826 RepID=UPI0031DDF2FD